MVGSFLLLIGSALLLTFGVYLQTRARRQVRSNIEASPDGPRIVERDGGLYFEDDLP